MNRKPNIIVIHTDQHNGLVLGKAGDPVVRTPNLDSLATHGAMATTCYCNSPLCVPSRSSFLTGRYPSDLQIFNNFNSLPSDIPTMAHCIGNAGYETVLCGRMHFIGPDQRHGFEKRIFNDFSWTQAGLKDRNEKETLEELTGTSFPCITAIEKSGAGSSAVLQYDKQVADAACSYISSRQNDRPLFLTIGLYGPHAPFVCPPELFDHYYNTIEVPTVTPETRAALHPAIRNWFSLRGVWDVSSEDIRRCKAAYYGLVEYDDHQIGRIIHAVQESLDLQNTVIVYFSDHGDTIGEHGLFWKTNFYEGSARVPFIVSWPDRIAPETRIETLTSLVDLAPTLIDIAGGDSLPLQRGTSLLAALTGASPLPERSVISQLADIKGDKPSAMIRKGPWKLVEHYGYPVPQLFNLENDPLEYQDLGNDPSFSDIIADLSRELHVHWNPQEVNNVLGISKKNNTIVIAWTKQAGLEPLEEWRPSGRVNYLA